MDHSRLANLGTRRRAKAIRNALPRHVEAFSRDRCVESLPSKRYDRAAIRAHRVQYRPAGSARARYAVSHEPDAGEGCERVAHREHSPNTCARSNCAPNEMNLVSLDVTVEPCASVEQRGWLPLRQLLWPHCATAEHLIEMRKFLAQPERFMQFVAYAESHQPVGLVEASLREDYVNGTESSPVAFLEALYVTPTHRRQGVARRLVAAVA